MRIKKTKFGFEIHTENTICFFGGKESQLINLQQEYSNFDFIRVKQNHGDVVVESNDPNKDFEIIADAHFSKRDKTALCVITADCVPLLISHKSSGYISTIHAGWRGVANQIIIKTIQYLRDLNLNPAELDVFIGPHIQKESFQVELDVRNQILASIPSVAQSEAHLITEQISTDKYLVDLNLVVEKQLHLVGIKAEKIFNFQIDTYGNGDFHSHRRDREKAGRQISFICKK